MSESAEAVNNGVPRRMTEREPEYMRVLTEREPKRTGARWPVLEATVLSCGLGGFNIASGGESPHCHLKCCRVDCDGCSLPFGILCCMCIGPWTKHAREIHRSRGVAYFKASW